MMTPVRTHAHALRALVGKTIKTVTSQDETHPEITLEATSGEKFVLSAYSTASKAIIQIDTPETFESDEAAFESQIFHWRGYGEEGPTPVHEIKIRTGAYILAASYIFATEDLRPFWNHQREVACIEIWSPDLVHEDGPYVFEWNQQNVLEIIKNEMWTENRRVEIVFGS